MDNESRQNLRAALLRAEYPYGKSQIWLPTDLHKVAARFDSVGIATDVIDLNLESLPPDLQRYHFVGIGVIGAPYISRTRKLAQEVKEMTGKNPLIGGPGVEYFTEEEFKVLYGDSIHIRNDSDLMAALQLQLPSVYDTTIAGRIKNMSSSKSTRYLQSEFSFFVSQGCKYTCNFCAASRTRDGNRVTEQFSRTIKEDITQLSESATSLGLGEIALYLTSLDLFQNPNQFSQVLHVFADAQQKYHINFKLRGLSRIDSFLDALQNVPKFYDLIPASGLSIVGFGVDGTTEAVWRSQHKGNKSLSDAEHAFKLCRQLGITPEALMVMGFHDAHGNPVDTHDSLRTNVDYCLSNADTYHVVSRPHVAKDMVPGNNGWKNPVWATQRATLFVEPELFKNLDFVALASEVTHPNDEFRHQVNDAYLDIVRALTPRGLCATSPLLPSTKEPFGDKILQTFNMLIPFDK